MATTYTLHSITCPTAVAVNATAALATAYPNARKHNCIYRLASVPANVRVTSVTTMVPPAPKQ